MQDDRKIRPQPIPEPIEPEPIPEPEPSEFVPVGVINEAILARANAAAIASGSTVDIGITVT